MFGLLTWLLKSQEPDVRSLIVVLSLWCNGEIGTLNWNQPEGIATLDQMLIIFGEKPCPRVGSKLYKVKVSYSLVSWTAQSPSVISYHLYFSGFRLSVISSPPLPLLWAKLSVKHEAVAAYAVSSLPLPPPVSIFFLSFPFLGICLFPSCFQNSSSLLLNSLLP